MVETCDEVARFKDHLQDPRRNTVVIGPGAGRNNPAGLKKAVLDAVQMMPRKVCILDADALTVFSSDPKILCHATGPHCVLTPHEGEFERLFPGLEGSKADRARAAAFKSRAIIVLKGHETIIASPEGMCAVNMNGTGWLATAGTGDVLAGMIAGLAARANEDLSLFEATCAAVWMHADAASRFGPGLISEDVPGQLPAVWSKLLKFGGI
jgi:NAD(P)H-hydrate epimerase